MTSVTDRIEYRTGTYRAVTPECTWERMYPLRDRFGITRVADITDLDEIGLPVAVAYRPGAATLAVSIGTGLSPVHARVSALMENIEAWHAENPGLAADITASARELELGYDVRSHNLAPRSFLTDFTVLDWVIGTGLLTGTDYPVPLDTVQVEFVSTAGWARRLFRPSTNGLASGNTGDEAALHALLELVERDCISEYTDQSEAEYRYIDPAGIQSPNARAVYDALLRAGCQIVVCDITNRIGIPCYAARVWSVDVPLRSGGFGCHVEPDLAIGRALAEAYQSRLAAVSGARDDIDADVYRPGLPLLDPSDIPGAVFVPPPGPPRFEDDSIGGVLRYCAQQVLAQTGVEPFALDLTQPGLDIPVRKIYAPGLRLFDPEVLETGRSSSDRG